jgi:Secretion system C-terminal sorting domain
MTISGIHKFCGLMSRVCRYCICLLCISLFTTSSQAQFAPVAGQPGTTAIPAESSALVGWATSCNIQRGYRDIAVHDSGYASVGDSSSAIGPATQNGIVSLGDGGIATLTFASPIVNGAGFDFAVFENGFNAGPSGMAFLELAFVEVSSDGIRYVRFPSLDNVEDTTQIALGYMDGSMLNNLAGKYVFGYGTPFDLEELKDSAGLDVNNITHVRVIDVIGTINPTYASRDSRGRIINDPYPTNFGSSGFDLDAVGVINQKTSTGISLTSENIANIYPNPFRNVLNLTTTQQGPCLGQITDINGRIIKEFIFDASLSLQLNDLSSGLYTIKLTNSESVFSKLIVKE